LLIFSSFLAWPRRFLFRHAHNAYFFFCHRFFFFFFFFFSVAQCTLCLPDVLASVAVLAALASCVRASGVYFCESFDTAFGTTPPNGWHNQDLIRGSYYNFVTEDLWRFDNPGEQELVYPIKGPSAIFDSDAYSSTDNLPENVALTSPIFDTRGVNFDSSSIVVDWDQYFVEGYEAKIFRRGVERLVVGRDLLGDVDDVQPGPPARGHHVARARPPRQGRRVARALPLDRRRVVVLGGRQRARARRRPLGERQRLPGVGAAQVRDDGACVAHESSCLLDNNCPANRPRRCLDGSCVEAGSAADDPTQCSDLVDCPADVPVRCADGSCQPSAASCHTASNCPISKPQRCNDGSCAATAYDCPLTLACPDEHNPYPCRGGSCAAAPELCPKAKASSSCARATRCSAST
jgi:hypothetical protein